LDVAQVQLEDAILDLNFVDGVENSLANSAQSGFIVGDTGNTGTNAPQWLFNKGADGSFENSYWAARYQNKDARFHSGHITSSGISATGEVSVTGGITSTGAVSAASGSITNALSCATFDAGTSIVLNSSTALTSITTQAAGGTMSDSAHDTLPTSFGVINHVNEVARKVMSYVDNMLHQPEFSIGAEAGGAQTVLWSGVLAADQFSTSANPTLGSKGTMNKHEYTCTINGLNIEPSAITSLKDYVNDNNGYVECVFDCAALDFIVDGADEVVLTGPMRAAVAV